MTKPKRRCPATSKRTGQQCKQYLPPGAVVCKWHGGQSPQALAAQDQRVATDAARADAAKLGVPIDTTPLDALATMLHEAMGNVAAFRLLAGDRDTPLGVNRFGENVVHPLTALYGEWVDRLAGIAKVCAALGLDERRVKVAEAHTTRLFDAVGRALATLPAKDREAFKVALAAELRRAA